MKTKTKLVALIALSLLTAAICGYSQLPGPQDVSARKNLTQFSLTVERGKPGGYYAPGTQVTVTADPAPPGLRFAGWTGDVVILANPSLSKTTATVPFMAVTITATYEVTATNEFDPTSGTYTSIDSGLVNSGAREFAPPENNSAEEKDGTLVIAQDELVPQEPDTAGSPSPPPAVAKDFDADGNADLVLENISSGQRVIWFLKKGVFSSSLSQKIMPLSLRIAGAGDFDGDGHADLAWQNISTGERGISLLKNGVLSSIIYLPTLPLSWRIAGAGDFDADGYADLALQNISTGQGKIWFLKNGVFSNSLVLKTLPLSWRIAGAGDFDGDGYADLALKNISTGQGKIWFLKNGVFSNSLVLKTLPLSWRIAGAGDFDADGYADLALQNISTGQRKIWFLKNGVFSSSLSLKTMPLKWNIVNH